MAVPEGGQHMLYDNGIRAHAGTIPGLFDDEDNGKQKCLVLESLFLNPENVSTNHL